MCDKIEEAKAHDVSFEVNNFHTCSLNVAN